MLITKNYLLLLFGVFILVTSTSCEKEEVEPRTREMELAELDQKIRELESNGVDVDTTNMSVFYYTTKAGEGPTPQEGDSCLVSYIGFLHDGRKFEDSWDIHPPDGIWRFNYKPDHKIEGLVDGIGYMNKGAQVEMYIPSHVAYGGKGNATVPPFTTLFYRVKMNDLITEE